jgi:hypothetical protein
MAYEGKTYQAPSGQWAWVVSKDGIDIVRGAGYESQDEAEQDLNDELENYNQRSE